jgi:uncharacterized protein YueI
MHEINDDQKKELLCTYREVVSALNEEDIMKE